MSLALVVAAFVLLASRPAAATLHASEPAVTFVKQREGFVNHGCPYRDPIGIWTRGYGRIEGITPLAPCITEPEAARELRALLASSYEPHVAALFRPGGALRGLFNQHRFDSLTSFVYNLGVGAVRCTGSGFETLCGAIRARAPGRIADAMLLYDKAAGIPFLGLTLRRQAERQMFMQPMGRFELFSAREVRLIQHYDRLRGHTSAAARNRRAELRAQMHAQSVRIDRAIRREHDALAHRRATRRAALDRRARQGEHR